MRNPPENRSLVLALSLALGGALLLVAFLLGRESARGTSVAEASLPEPPVLSTAAEKASNALEPAEERRWPAWADLEEAEDAEVVAVEARPVRMEKRPGGTVLLSNRNASAALTAAPSSPDASSNDRAVSAYFAQMDGIRSHSGAGDPDTFAMGLIKAGMGGSTAGFDQLIADTKRMQERAEGIVPPASCRQYHAATLQSLAEGREVLEDMKSAFARRDFNGLAGIAQQAGTLQEKAEALRQLREQIEADARR